MCGIAGIISRKQVSESSIEEMTNLLNRRGPDDVGVYRDEYVSLGHRRLSIIDLATGHQPMVSDDNLKVIVFNGEIYNFKSVREELLGVGQVFKTTSDTEVLLKGYEAFGLDGLLSRIEGMFAFAIYDRKIEKVFLVRDRFGEKPLYYFEDELGFYFASEIKALLPRLQNKSIDLTALNLFLGLTYIPAPFTIYQQIRKVEAGEAIQVTKDGSVKRYKYYSLSQDILSTTPYLSYKSAMKDIRFLLENSVEQRMISDVPIGTFLSGGIDSSIVSAIMAKKSEVPIQTFSIGFKEPSYDESARSNLVAKHIGSSHNLYTISHQDLLQATDSILDYFDEPFGDSSAIPSWMVAKKASEKVKVVLTGDCADELFGGYEKYLAPYYVEKYNFWPPVIRKIFEMFVSIIPHHAITNHLLRKVKKIIKNASLQDFDLHYNLMLMGFSDEERVSILKSEWKKDIKPIMAERFSKLSGRHQMDKGFYSDVKVVLEGDMLPKVDRMSMINSLEARVPFLDSKIVRSSFRMPSEFKINGKNKKRILKDAFADLLPKEVFSFSKKGFGVPLALWFRNELRGELEAVLGSDRIEKQNIFDKQEINKLLSNHLTGKENNSSKLWCLFVFQKWYFKNIEQ
ncbi:MAG: asparagine synthase (glutamine-hydrolyzing) [Cyclobacteriaceae bacterium]|jgi:asparagine synthase (glutamine-hydrolysing)